MMHTRTTIAALVLLAVSIPGVSHATQPCEPGIVDQEAQLPPTLDVPATAEQICGIAARRVSLHTFEITGSMIPAGATASGNSYLLEQKDGRRSIWSPVAASERPWLVGQAAAIHPVLLAERNGELERSDREGCYELPELERGHYLVVSGAESEEQIRTVATSLRVNGGSADTLPAPAIRGVDSREAPRSCSAHGLFVVQIDGRPSRLWRYEWTVRDHQGRIVQRGSGLRPHALGEASAEDDGTYQLHKALGGIDKTQRPYVADQSYAIGVRAVDFVGRSSEPSSAQFTFEQTGEGRYQGLALIAALVVFGCPLGFVAIVAFAVRALLASQDD